MRSNPTSVGEREGGGYVSEGRAVTPTHFSTIPT